MSDAEEELARKPLKLALIGDGASGKTSIVNHFVHGKSGKEYNQTLGVEFYLKSVRLPGGHCFNVQLWDIGGQTLGGKMLDKYLYASDGVLLIYDITNEDSFDNLEDWLSVVRSLVVGSKLSGPTSSLPYMALVANKSDLEHLRLVKREKHDRFAQVNGLTSYTMSARTGEAVNACFQKIVADLVGLSSVVGEMDDGRGGGGGGGLSEGEQVYNVDLDQRPVLVAEIVKEPDVVSLMRPIPALVTSSHSAVCHIQ